jgi:anti-sigma factor RsiW
MNVAAPASERIRAYLDGTLSEQELEEFELSLFDDPDLAEAVDAERLLREGLREIEARRNAGGGNTVVPLPPRRAVAPRWLSLAASLLVGVLIGAIARNPAPLPATGVPPTAAGSIGGKTQFEALGTSRGPASEEVAIMLRPDAPQLALQFTRPRRDTVRSYVFELDLPGGGTRAFPDLMPESDARISITLVAAALPAGRYHARLIAIGNDGSRSEDQDRHFVLQRTGAAP